MVEGVEAARNGYHHPVNGLRPPLQRRWPVAMASLAVLGLTACAGGADPNADGDFVGVVSRVWEDGLRLDVDSGGSIRVDTWNVCGDATARNISVGDRITVSAERDILNFDAFEILDEDGRPAC